MRYHNSEDLRKVGKGYYFKIQMFYSSKFSREGKFNSAYVSNGLIITNTICTVIIASKVEFQTSVSRILALHQREMFTEEMSKSCTL